jgi:hypothetical protein
LALASCGSSGDDVVNQNQGGSTVATNGSAGQSNGAGGAQAISAAGGKGVLQEVGAGGTTKATNTNTGAGGKAKVGSGGKAATSGNGGKGGTKAAGGKAGDTGPTVACTNPAEKSAPIPVKWTSMGQPESGPYKVVVEEDPTMPNTTTAHPDLTNLDIKLPIIAWVNGGCMNCSLLYMEFLSEIASHGFMMVVDGTPIDRENPCNSTNIFTSGAVPQGQNGETHKKQITWAIAENERPCSQYYHKLDTKKVATMGQSCGGMSTWMSADDPRLTTMVVLNMGMGGDPTSLAKQHVPVANFVGGTSDIGKSAADADFAANNTKYPLFFGSDPDMPHEAGYNTENGGPWAPIVGAWLAWQLKGDEGATTGKGMFWGKDCGLCNTDWVIQKKNME